MPNWSRPRPTWDDWENLSVATAMDRTARDHVRIGKQHAMAGCVGLLVGCLCVSVLPGPGASPRARGDTEDGFLGVLVARLEADLQPHIEGRLREIHVRIGDKVEAGAIVAELDERPIRQELARAQAELDEARATMAEATTRLSIAQENLEQRKELARQEIVPLEQVREAEQQKELAQAGFDKAHAKVKQQDTKVEQLEDKLAHSRIVAPFAGTVAERYGNPGMMVEPGTVVARVIGSQGLWARFAVPVGNARGLSVGANVRVTVRDLDLTIIGSITQIASQIDPASGMIICEAVVDAPPQWDGPPLPGQVVRITLEEK